MAEQLPIFRRPRDDTTDDNRRPMDDHLDAETEECALAPPSSRYLSTHVADEKVVILTPKHHSNHIQTCKIKFPLTPKQDKLLCVGDNEHVLSRLNKIQGCEVRVDVELHHANEKSEQPVLILLMQSSVKHRKTRAFHHLERNLGILLTTEDIARIRKEICPVQEAAEKKEESKKEDPVNEAYPHKDAEEDKEEEEEDEDEETVEWSGDHTYVNEMKALLHSGVECIHYSENDQIRTFLTIPEMIGAHHTCDRLYFRDSREHRLNEEESLHLSEISAVRMTMGDILGVVTPTATADFRFSVELTKKRSLDFRMVTESSLQVRKVVAYLDFLCRHFTKPCVRRLDTPANDVKW